MYLIAYDIKNDRIRNKISTILEDFGDRVQYSLFELNVDNITVERIKSRIKKLINVENDSVKIYFLPDNWGKNIITLGKNKKNEILDVIVL
jgi:CRISPR-associated protein Cas2